MTRVLGLDPGLAETGYGLIAHTANQSKHLAHGCIRTGTEDALEIRLKRIFLETTALIETWRPEMASIESLFFAKNASSAIPVSHARGVLLLACAIAGIPVFEYTPNEIKSAVVGTGSADKKQVQAMVKLVLGMREEAKPDHAADALAAAICHVHSSVLSRSQFKG